MIPCFPANNSTDVHHCDIVSNRSSPSHFTKDSPSNNLRNLFPKSQVRTRLTTKTFCHSAWYHKSKRILFEKYLSDKGECSCCSLSQDD